MGKAKREVKLERGKARYDAYMQQRLEERVFNFTPRWGTGSEAKAKRLAGAVRTRTRADLSEEEKLRFGL